MATLKKVTKKVTKKAAPEKKVPTIKEITIPALKMATAKITIVGTSPLLVNKFDEKMKQQLEDDYVAKKTKTVKKETDYRTPEQEFLASLYPFPGGTVKKPKYGIPVSGLKKCAISATKFVDGVASTTTKGSFHIIDDVDGLVEIKTKGGPRMDTRMVRVGNFPNKKPATRRRGRFDDWSITFTVRYRPDIISPEQLLNLYENAGFGIGLCEYRPEKDGSLGMFQVARK